MGSIVQFRNSTLKTESQPNTFGDWLRERREAARLSQQEVADRAGVSKAYVSNIERNMAHSVSGALPKPTVEKVDALSRAVGGSVAEGRLIAGYAPPGSAQLDAEQTRLLFYFNDLAEAARGDALAMLEALWRSHQARKRVERQQQKEKKRA